MFLYVERGGKEIVYSLFQYPRAMVTLCTCTTQYYTFTKHRKIESVRFQFIGIGASTRKIENNESGRVFKRETKQKKTNGWRDEGSRAKKNKAVYQANIER